MKSYARNASISPASEVQRHMSLFYGNSMVLNAVVGMMKSVAKYIPGAVVIGAGAMAAVIAIPDLVSETTGQAAAAFVAPAQAETMRVAQAQQPSPTAAAPLTFANGATSVRESYADWQVVCAIRDRAKVCRMVQQQSDSKTRQRVLAIELTGKADGIEGTLILPFGLLLDKGVTLQVDDGAPGQAFSFKTCVPTGCLVPLNLEAPIVAVMTKGATLKVNTITDGPKELGFAISLRGFGAARKRVADLLG